MDNDDRQIGRILSRREVLALLGAAGATLLVGCGPAQSGSGATAAPATAAASAAPTTAAATSVPKAEAATAVAMQGNPTVPATAAAGDSTVVAANGASVPACVVRPEVTEGPYYVAEDLVRSDIREDRQGTLLALTFNVSQIGNSSCTPLQGATVEIWHCDAAGQYSDVSDPGFNTKGQKWLRGAQVTDANGQAMFTTIYPGWYSSRAVHIHFKVHPTASTVFTSQLFFDDTLSDQVFMQAPYASKGQRDTLNSKDSIYKDTLLLTVNKTDQSYAAAFDIGMQKA
jgi:protocatechuate 3,4-dioxygenase beta subunit